MITLATMLSQRWLTQGPRTSGSLHSSSRNTLALAAGSAAAFAWLKIKQLRRGGARAREAVPFADMTRAERLNWRMPPLALLKPVAWSPGTKLGVLMLRGYLVVSVILLVVKAVQLGGG